MDPQKATSFVEQQWPDIESTLSKFIAIPSSSPDYDPEWQTNGLIEQIVDLLSAWVDRQNVTGLKKRIVREAGRTPLMFLDIPATGDAKGTILLYGHMDKQPPFEGWAEDLGPYKPVIKNGRLYGRGGADDGYALFGAVTAIKTCHEQGIPLARCVILIESREESEGDDLEYYLKQLKEEIGEPNLIVCLDSGCGNYDQLWGTTSLRGVICGHLTVKILREGVHSGDASGIVPSSFRIIRSLISRLEDEQTGRVLLDDLYCPIPDHRVAEAHSVASVLGENVMRQHYPFVGQARPVHDSVPENILARTWKPQLSVTGAEGLPSLTNAGNVLRPYTTLALSMRVPPNVDPTKARDAMKRVLERDPPYGAHVEFSGEGYPGWEAPAEPEWLSKAIQSSSSTVFGKPALAFGEGGSIPFMGLLGSLFPKASFFITGVLGPESNAHGPNEFLDIAYTKKIITCLSLILADTAKAF